jgi:nitric oxide reductase NorD protein
MKNKNGKKRGSSSAIRLQEVQKVLDIYLSGLMKNPPGVRQNRIWQEGRGYIFGLIRRGNKQVSASPEDSYTDLRGIFLPEQIGAFSEPEENFSLYKAIVAHKYGQIRFGSLEVLGLFDKIEDPRLALDLFSLIENARMERHLTSEMGGLKRLLKTFQDHFLATRNGVSSMTPKDAKVEALLRNSLDVCADVSEFSTDVQRWMEPYRDEMLHLIGNGNTPADSARLALGIMRGLNRDEGEYRGIDPVLYRGKIHLGPVLRTLRGAIKVESVGKISEQEKDFEDTDRKELATERNITPQETGFDEEEAKRGVLLNRFEKISMIAKYFKISRPIDSDEDVEDLSKSLDELESTGMIRTARKAGSILMVEEDFDFEIEAMDPDLVEGLPGILYDEWDCRISDFHKDWCNLREHTYERHDLEWAEKLIKEKTHLFTKVRREFLTLRPEYQKLRKRIHGEEVDIDAFIEALADIRAGVVPSEKLYIKRARRRKEIATAFLADLSASTDAYVKNLRVMDQQREALLLLGEAMEAIQDRYAIYGFSSKTRKQCDFYTLKGFDESYGTESKARIGGMKPLDYTRMGPAIRHLTETLKTVRARTKLMIILSDGKPNDFDVYEGKYGIEDIKKALLQARAFGIQSFCITVDSEARDYLPYIFERGNYLILDDIESLPQKLVGMYRKLTVLAGSAR